MSRQLKDKSGKRKLVTLDLDGTMFRGNSVLFLKDKGLVAGGVRDLHAKYNSGEISERELNYKQMPYLEGKKFSSLFKALAEGPLLQNIQGGVDLLKKEKKKENYTVSMLTFNPLQFFFKRRYGIDASISTSVEMKDDVIARVNNLPENKVEYLKTYCARNSIEFIDCIHVGDGPNDIPTFKLVGCSIALNAESNLVRDAATISIETNDFELVSKQILQL